MGSSSQSGKRRAAMVATGATPEQQPLFASALEATK
jgi:hypothetical protein